MDKPGYSRTVSRYNIQTDRISDSMGYRSVEYWRNERLMIEDNVSVSLMYGAESSWGSCEKTTISIGYYCANRPDENGKPCRIYNRQGGIRFSDDMGNHTMVMQARNADIDRYYYDGSPTCLRSVNITGDVLIRLSDTFIHRKMRISGHASPMAYPHDIAGRKLYYEGKRVQLL